MSLTRRTLVAAAVMVLATSANANPFADKEGQRRLFVVFSPTSDHAGYRQMVAQTKTGKFGLRDLDLVEVAGRTVQVNGSALESPTAEELRRFYRVDKDAHAVRLVGKDGSVKLAETGYVRMDEVYALIDSMPAGQ